MNRLLVPLAFSAGALAIALPAAADDALDMTFTGTTRIAVFGDSPYGTKPTDTAEFDVYPTLVNSINADPSVALVLHVGDIHSGKTYCTAKYDQDIYNFWTAFQKPLVYTPGDNEWTDCHKTGEGGGLYNKTTGQIDYLTDPNGQLLDYAGGNPAQNLELVRSIFFSDPGFTLGGRKLVLSQRYFYDRAHPSDANYAENVIFVKSRVLFVAVNVPGGSNNDQDIWYKAPTMSPEQAQDVSDRSAADIRWLDTAFALARLLRLNAVVIQTQADMWDLDGTAAGGPGQVAPHLTGYEGIIGDIAANANAFKKPVLLFNGDSHRFRSDNPLSQGAACIVEPVAGGAAEACGADDPWLQHPLYNVPNFHRVVVHGSTFPFEWVKVTIEPRANAPAGASLSAFGPFSWERVPVPLP